MHEHDHSRPFFSVLKGAAGSNKGVVAEKTAEACSNDGHLGRNCPAISTLHLGEHLRLSCDVPFLHSFCETSIVFPLSLQIYNKPIHNVICSSSYPSRSPTALCSPNMLQ